MRGWVRAPQIHIFTMVVGVPVFVYVNAYTYRLLIFIEFFIQQFFWAHPKYTQRYRIRIFSPHSLGSLIPLLFQCATAFHDPGAGVHVYLFRFLWRLWWKNGFCGPVLPLIPTGYPQYLKQRLKDIQRQWWSQEKRFHRWVSLYFMYAPGESLNCFLCPQGCWRWHILILVGFNFLGIKLCFRLYVCRYTLLQLGIFLLLFSFFSFFLYTCCWLLI